MLDRCVVVYQAPYPGSLNANAPHVHDEPMVVGKDGKLIGFWYSLQKFLDDYNPEKNQYANPELKPWINVVIFDMASQSITYYFPKEKLNKVLNND